MRKNVGGSDSGRTAVSPSIFMKGLSESMINYSQERSATGRGFELDKLSDKDYITHCTARFDTKCF